MMEEWDMYDGKGNLLGRRIRRGEPIPPGCRYLAAEAWITDGRGRLLVQQRAWAKKLFPGCWGMTTGCMAAGEDSRQGMAREIGEELGIVVSGESLQFQCRFVREDSIWDVYRLEMDVPLEALRLQKEEVAQAAWMTPGQIRELVSRGQAVAYPEFNALLSQAEQEWLQ